MELMWNISQMSGARNCIARGELAEAKEWLAELLEKRLDPINADAITLAIEHLNAGHPDDAIRALDNALLAQGVSVNVLR